MATKSGQIETYAWATCCKSNTNGVTIGCSMIGGEHSSDWIQNANNTGKLSSITCPIGQFMASCSGFGYWWNTNAWWIASNDTCCARNWVPQTEAAASTIWYTLY